MTHSQPQLSVPAPRYLGSKRGAGVYQAIISQFPPHDLYIEPFLGTGAIMRLKPPAPHSIGIDLLPYCIDSYVHAAGESLELICGDGMATIAKYRYGGSRTLIYCDPPYLLSTRTSKNRYVHDFTEADHIRLLQALRASTCSIAISGYPSQLYDDWLSPWRTVTFQAMTRGGVRTEKLWMNYPAIPHWHTYAGRNFTDRQRIKRKAARWAADFAHIPPGERLAILAVLLAKIDNDN